VGTGVASAGVAPVEGLAVCDGVADAVVLTVVGAAVAVAVAMSVGEGRRVGLGGGVVAVGGTGLGAGVAVAGGAATRTGVKVAVGRPRRTRMGERMVTWAPQAAARRVKSRSNRALARTETPSAEPTAPSIPRRWGGVK